jgi:group I intron endonuclease
MNNIGIYKITNKKNGKFYIGSSKHIDRRWWEHKNDLNKNQHTNLKLQHAWNYYGPDCFELVILENVDESKLLEREQFYLDTFVPYKRNIGYNIGDKAYGGDNFTHNPNKEEILKRITQLNNTNRMHGKNHSPEAIDKQKSAASGRYTLEWFISRYGEEGGLTMYNQRNQRLKDRDINYVYDNGLKGTKKGTMSQEMRDKISETKRMFKQNKQQFMNELQSGLFTNKQLSEKYGVSEVTVKYYKRKLS